MVDLPLSAVHETAVEHVHHPMGALCMFFGVGHHDDGGAAVHDTREHFHHRLTIGGIKIAGRLVGKDQLWICDKGACYGHSLLLATRELLRHMTGSMH